MHRIAQIKAHLSHRRSKSDSNIDQWTTGCLEGDDDDNNSDDDEAFAKPPDRSPGDFHIDVEAIVEPSASPASGSGAGPKRGSAPTLFLTQFSNSFRRRLANVSNGRSASAADGDPLTPTEPASGFSYDNEGRRSPPPPPEGPTTASEPLAAAEAEVDAFGASPAWVTFESEPGWSLSESWSHPGGRQSATSPPGPGHSFGEGPEFEEVPLDDVVKEVGPRQRFVNSLRRLPGKFRAGGARYQSLESDTIGWGEDGRLRAEMLEAGRASSLPSTPEVRKKKMLGRF